MNEVSPIIGDQVVDHLRNLSTHKSIEPNERHPRDLRELADTVAKTISIVFEKLWLSDEIPSD